MGLIFTFSPTFVLLSRNQLLVVVLALNHAASLFFTRALALVLTDCDIFKLPKSHSNRVVQREPKSEGADLMNKLVINFSNVAFLLLADITTPFF